MATAMRVEVNGIEILPDQCPRSEGWKTAGERARQKGLGELSLTPVLRESQGGAKATADVDQPEQQPSQAGRRHRQQIHCHSRVKHVVLLANITLGSPDFHPARLDPHGCHEQTQTLAPPARPAKQPPVPSQPVLPSLHPEQSPTPAFLPLKGLRPETETWLDPVLSLLPPTLRAAKRLTLVAAPRCPRYARRLAVNRRRRMLTPEAASSPLSSLARTLVLCRTYVAAHAAQQLKPVFATRPPRPPPIDPNQKWCDKEFENTGRNLHERFEELFRIATEARRRWYSSVLREAPTRPLVTWEEWQKALREDFAGEHVQDWAYIQLQERRQLPGETPRQYVSSILHLCARANTTMTGGRKGALPVARVAPGNDGEGGDIQSQTTNKFLQHLQRLTHVGTMAQHAMAAMPTHSLPPDS
ncbi:hypothetical protein HPB48_013019 [Haemaphysalis longicornis]|uniref:Retrotransposon gag domain-containing protein n=1 Tax=Haemaphysalis longicornis TaxID=44386 RepID=A0A9J6GTA5_HAELO|nr:hypothetical protein HPB48_013019 [Haemaphysalis longicornis]